MEIVTGSTGQVHVTPIDDAVRNGNPGYLKGKIILDYLDNFAATIVSNSYVRVSSGYGMNQGRIFKINSGDYDNVPIENGAQGYKRADLIVARYSMDVQTGFESMELVAIKGAAGSTYVDPSYMTGDINGNIISSDFHDDFPLYRVRINGTTLEGLDRLFTPVPDGGRLGQLEAKVTSHINAFNALNFRTNLASEATALPKNGANVRPGVEGTLPVSHGGTGQTTLKAAGDSIIGSLGDNNTAPTDSTVFIGSTPNTSGFQKKTMASLWTYLTGKIRTLLGMGTNNVVPISHGGTGKTSITNNNILVGNAGGGFDEWGIDTAPSSANAKKLITSKGVADALGNAGYGDMMKSTYDPNNDGIIAVGQGGTGANTVAGARNNLGLGNTSGALPIANGGTGAASVAAARNNLGLGNTAGALPAANGGTGQTSLQATRNAMGLGNTTGALPIANGGTGAATAALARNNLGLGNTTGALPIANGGTGQTTAAAARNALGLGNTTGALPIANGGTGQTTAAGARNALGLGNTTGALPIANGGTGATSASAARTNLGAMSTGGGTFSGNVTIDRENGTTSSLGQSQLILGNNIPLGTAKNTRGSLAIYSQGSTYIGLRAALGNESTNVFLPADRNGETLATTEQLDNYVKKTGSNSMSGSLSVYDLSSTSFSTDFASLNGNVGVGKSKTRNGAINFYQQATNYAVKLVADKKLDADHSISIPSSSGTMQVSLPSSRRVKENIKDMSEDKAKRILDVNVVDFDYIGNFGGGLKNQCGVIAEDTFNIIPEAIEMADEYDETKPIDERTNPAPTVDYRKFVPYLIKMVQIQQKEIEELKKR